LVVVPVLSPLEGAGTFPRPFNGLKNYRLRQISRCGREANSAMAKVRTEKVKIISTVSMMVSL
jgi:hypothetical protein